jgi:DNA-binding PadR family transcriptional regulator
VVEVLSIRFMSPVTASMIQLIIAKGHARAYELSEATNTESKRVYTQLKHWIARGFIKAEKDPITKVNIYSLTDKTKTLINEIKTSSKTQQTKSKARKTRERSWRRLRRCIGRDSAKK